MGELGAQFARALAAKDSSRLTELLHPEVDFRAMTPRRVWEAGSVDEMLAVFFENWFEESDVIEAIDRLESEDFADRERVGYRFRVTNPKGSFLVDQQAYIADRDGRIGWLRVMCAGYRRNGG